MQIILPQPINDILQKSFSEWDITLDFPSLTMDSLLDNGLFFVYSDAIRVNNNGILVTGGSKVGKSTTLERLSVFPNVSQIDQDSVAIYNGGEETYVLPGYNLKNNLATTGAIKGFPLTRVLYLVRPADVQGIDGVVSKVKMHPNLTKISEYLAIVERELMRVPMQEFKATARKGSHFHVTDQTVQDIKDYLGL